MGALGQIGKRLLPFSTEGSQSGLVNFIGNTTPYGAYDATLGERSRTIKGEQAAQEASDVAAAQQAINERAATEAANAAAEAKKVADAKAAADKAAADAADLLAFRRRSSSAYGTAGGAKGILGGSPVKAKTLLGA